MNTSFPSPTPMSAVNAEQLQLIHQFQMNQISNTHGLLLYISFLNPLPVAWKLTIYHFLIALPLPKLSPLTITILVITEPIFIFAVLFFIFKFIQKILKNGFPSILSGLVTKHEEKIFLELSFPTYTSKSAYATEELYTVLHSLAKQHTFLKSFFKQKNIYSLEIVSTKNEGIRYVVAAPKKQADVVKKSLLSYLAGIKIKEIDDYLKYQNFKDNKKINIIELKLSSHFAFPLNKQKTLSEHDPISYLTGNMTKLTQNELISFQIVTTPLLSSSYPNIIAKINELRNSIYKSQPLTPLLQKNFFEKFATLHIIPIIGYFIKIRQILNPYETELSDIIKEKIDQPLFETSIRILIVGNSERMESRISGLISSFGLTSTIYQSLITKESLILKSLTSKIRLNKFRQRKLSLNMASENPILSVSELSDLYHLPYTSTTKTEDMIKIHSTDLPTPLSLKKDNSLDVVFAQNNYGGTTTEIGLTKKEREKHMFMIGETGSGKSTIIFHMAKDDIQKGRGVAIIDPHGDLAKDLLSTIPEDRVNDCVYFNPFDLKYPIGINLLELPDGLDEDELELEKELVTEGVISVFRRIFSKDENANAHRIEYILRNTIYTAFTVKDRTIFTVYELLSNPDYRKNITNNLEDENLKNFWKNEFEKAGNWQQVKMTSGVTAKIGRFLFSPIAKRILEQPKSTINFDDILDYEKILICNISEGNLGEDTSQLLGTMILAKIQQAALRRARKEFTARKPFYLYIDEFQTFATTSFTKMLSGGRKFGLRITIAEQSTSQQDDQNIVNIILANTANVVCFRTANPNDEKLLLTQFAPSVQKGDIANLSKFRFYMKKSAIEPEETFTGETIPIAINYNETKIQNLIDASRKNYAAVYKKKDIKKEAFKKPEEETVIPSESSLPKKEKLSPPVDSKK